jgi:hypothetical protein
MEFDQTTSPVWIVDSLSSHDFLDIESPFDKAILDIMASLDKPKDEVMNQ